MNVDIGLLQALENAWATTASNIRDLDAENTWASASGVGLPGSLTEGSMRVDVVKQAFDTTAEHFEALESLTRGSHNDYVIAESLFVKLVHWAGYR